MSDCIGLLALQGDYELHRRTLTRLGAETTYVRRPGELAACSALVIPGGESTTLIRLIDRNGLRESLVRFAQRKPVLGTCAGLIVLARELADEKPGDHGVAPLGLLNCTVQRNAYGRQVDSFSENVSIEPLTGSVEPFPAVYIRAPRILTIGDGVDVVVTRGTEPVGVRQANLLCLTFHPELTEDTRLHASFLQLIGTV